MILNCFTWISLYVCLDLDHLKTHFYTVEPLYNGHHWDLWNFSYMEVSLIQRLINTVIYYCGMRTSFLNRNVLYLAVLSGVVPLYLLCNRAILHVIVCTVINLLWVKAQGKDEAWMKHNYMFGYSTVCYICHMAIFWM